MRLPKLAIDNYQFTLVVVALLLLMGISSYLTMPRTEDPPVYIPGASVIVIYPGANPYDMEELVAQPIEEAINELDDIKKIETRMLDGFASIAVEFNFETDADEKFNDVVQKVNAIKEILPDDVYSLDVQQWSSTDVSILQLAFTSETASFNQMGDAAEQLKDEFEKIGDVKKVEIFALPEREVRISLNMEKMAMMNISINQISQILQGNNANIPGGSLKLQGKNFNIKTSGSYKSLDEIRRTIVGAHQGRIVYLESVAEVNYDYEDNKYYARFDGTRAIFLSVQQKENMNIFSIMEEINTALDDFKTQLPTNITLHRAFDQSESVDFRINGFMNNLVQGIILVGIVIFLALGFRAALLVMLAIPFSILISLGFVDLSGFGLQQISIAALVIALGLLVDNAIVIVENIERYIRMGYKRRKAAIKATSELGWPVISATATTMLAFVPLIMMPDKAGAFIESLPVTVIFTLLASLVLALTFLPMVARRFLKKNASNKPDFNQKGIGKFLKRLIEGPYRNTLKYALRKPWLIVGLALLSLVAAGGLFFAVGVTFFPKAERPQLMVRVNAPEGTNIDYTDEITRQVEKVLDTIPLIQHYATNVGHGNPRIYYNIFPKFFTKNYAEIMVVLQEYEIESFDELVSQLRSTFANYPGARIEIKELEQGTPIEAPVSLKLLGEDIQILRKIAEDVEAIVRQTPGAINVDNQLNRKGTDLFFDINRDKAGMLGVPIVSIDQTIRASVAGSIVSEFRNREGEEFNMVLRLPVNGKTSINDFDKIYVRSMSGKFIPLRQLVTISFQDSPGLVTHYNLSRSATINADLESGYYLDEVVNAIESYLQDYNWPRGYTYKYAGEVESRQESFGGMARASIIALIAIFALLVLQFKSLSQPLIIYSAIPLAVIGSVLALLITGNSFSFTAFVGVISLIGIVINNSIILVDYTNNQLAEGKSIDEALKISGETRFTPIVLTTLTTIGGLLPLTLQGGTLWAPMGWTIIGGLFVSTFLTLIVVPVLYKLLTPVKHKRKE